MDALIVAGDGSPVFRASIGIIGDRIVTIGEVDRAGAYQVIECAGLHAAPGFVDIHDHTDVDILAAPEADNMLRQGVTTVVGGNCGSQSYPLAELFRGIEAQGVALNFAALAGHGTLRFLVMGERQTPTEADLVAMEALVEQEMASGAMGLSTGLFYRPGAYAGTAEVVRLAAVAARHGGLYASHVRDESLGLRDAIAEAITIGETNRMPVQISHIKLGGGAVWGQPWLITDQVEAARARGVDVTTDQHPYTASTTNFRSLVPAWAWQGSHQAFRTYLQSPGNYRTLRSYNLQSFFPFGLDGFLVRSFATSPDYGGGKTFRTILSEKGLEPTSEHGAELLIEIQSGGPAQGFILGMQEADVRAFLPLPYNMISSDASLWRDEWDGIPHPRDFGTFPRVLGRYVRELGLLTLPDAVRKMTDLPARRLGLDDRGRIAPGAYADIVLFDAASVRDTADLAEPRRHPEGIVHVIVNGEVALRDGLPTGARNGRVLRGPGWEP